MNDNQNIENNIIKFENPINNFEITCVILNTEPWFLCSELAKILGYTKYDKAYKHIDEDDKKTLDNIYLQNGVGIKIPSNSLITNESGFYSFIMSDIYNFP